MYLLCFKHIQAPHPGPMSIPKSQKKQLWNPHCNWVVQIANKSPKLFQSASPGAPEIHRKSTKIQVWSPRCPSKFQPLSGTLKHDWSTNPVRAVFLKVPTNSVSSNSVNKLCVNKLCQQTLSTNYVNKLCVNKLCVNKLGQQILCQRIMSTNYVSKLCRQFMCQQIMSTNPVN